MKKIYDTLVHARKKIYSILVLFLFLVFIHSTYLANGFTWLDHTDIERKQAVRPLTNSAQILREPFGDTGFYRPVVTVVNSLDDIIYGSTPLGFHLTNVLLHLSVVAVLPLFLSVFFTFTFPEMLLIMMIVGIHHFGILPVGAIAYRAESLVALGILLTVYFHAKTRTTGKLSYALSTLFFLFIALFSKETALFVVPAVLFVWEFTKHKQQRKNPWLFLWLPEIIIYITYLQLRHFAIPDSWHVQPFSSSPDIYFGTHIYSLVRLVLAFINPFPLTLSDAIPLTSVWSLPTVLFCFLLAISIVLYRTYGRKSNLSKALMLFWIMLLPAFSIIPVPRLGSPHYGYLPLLIFPIFILLIKRRVATQSTTLKLICVIILIVWMGILTYSKITYGSRFLNDKTLFEQAVQQEPHFLEGYLYLGNYHALHHDYAAAKKVYYQILSPTPGYAAYTDRNAAALNLAQILIREGNPKEAIPLLESILPNTNTNQRQRLQQFINLLKQH